MESGRAEGIQVIKCLWPPALHASPELRLLLSPPNVFSFPPHLHYFQGLNNQPTGSWTTQRARVRGPTAKHQVESKLSCPLAAQQLVSSPPYSVDMGPKKKTAGCGETRVEPGEGSGQKNQRLSSCCPAWPWPQSPESLESFTWLCLFQLNKMEVGVPKEALITL